jgi:acetyl-CoA carboxylase biotin carboxylase subunit
VVERFNAPGGFGVRVDSHMRAGARISPRYDSMIAKLIVHRSTRTEAIACMLRCLDEFTVEPTKTTIGLHKQIISHEAFASGKFDTGFVASLLSPT